MVPQTLPLFPLGTVLVPGLVLPLHVFEERYRDLVRDLVDAAEPRRFGVVAIRQGREVALHGGGAPELHPVGCMAELRQVQRYDDGRYLIVTTGTQRFRIATVDDASHAYLSAEVETLVDAVGADAGVLAPVVQTAFRGYLSAVAAAQGEEIDAEGLPGDPDVLSWLVCATLLVDVEDKQTLLAADDAADRLRLELSLIRRETALLGRVASSPARDLLGRPPSLN